MSYSDDDYDEQYEEYCRRYEEEEIIYVDGGIPIDEYDELYIQAYDKKLSLNLQWLRKTSQR